ncbi:MAG: hypothetical protein GPOALKHO_001328 [Sodalis sp.]|uniref:hypothetical protein n=1 Tax=Sodalis sp. (in: enterobacteria) TaxID=1898979 RepID=UPI0038738A52|nr:MAG: hypothetical protein GPOALKHO_001328 [Sodalis sp.]
MGTDACLTKSVSSQCLLPLLQSPPALRSGDELKVVAPCLPLIVMAVDDNSVNPDRRPVTRTESTPFCNSAAIRLRQQKPLDIILMGIQMPKSMVFAPRN